MCKSALTVRRYRLKYLGVKGANMCYVMRVINSHKYFYSFVQICIYIQHNMYTFTEGQKLNIGKC